MARKERIHIPGAVYHVILRGNDRRDIFGDDKDRFRFYGILDLSFQRFPFKIHAFCLMTNHVHLEIQVGDVPLPKIMQTIAQRYTQWFNWRYHKTGHVFQGRYKAIMVDADEYLLELAAYIHLNPVRAKLTDRPEKYKWSSHRAFLGSELLSWLETSFILSQFSSNLKKARSLFNDFVTGGLDQGRRKEFHGEKNIDNRVFGDEAFVATVLEETQEAPLQRKPDLKAIVAAIQKTYGIQAEKLLTTTSRDRLSFEARALAAWATLELSSATLTELARFCNRHESTMTCAVKRIESLKIHRPDVATKMAELRDELTQ